MRFLLILFACLCAAPLWAASSNVIENERIRARLISVENSIAPEIGRISAALDIQLKEGWKTYWEFPGEAGLPPRLRWEGSENIQSVDIHYPSPTRFELFDLQNIGYENHVSYPISIVLEKPGQSAVLRFEANLLICSDVCIPEMHRFEMSLPKGMMSKDFDAGAIISEAVAQVPMTSDTPITAHWGEERFDLILPDEMRPPEEAFAHYVGFATLSAPKITRQGISYAHQDPEEENPPSAVTLISQGQAVTYDLAYVDAPIAQGARGGVWIAFLFAVIGGLILNVMPCVLPVLAIKFAGLIQSEKDDRLRVRMGFFATAAGILTFCVGLALILVVMRAFGANLGFGVQFQSPLFLTFVFAVLLLFAANLMDYFDFSLPPRWTDRLARLGGGGKWVGDYATGLFAALLATPCSAPFMGTALSYALSAPYVESVFVFAGLGVGMALPYLLAGMLPSVVRYLPKPGPWMARIKLILGLGVLATAFWVASLLVGTLGFARAGAICAVTILGLAIWLFRGKLQLPAWGRSLFIPILFLGVLVLTIIPHRPAVNVVASQTIWEVYSPERLSEALKKDEVVFIDVTADWCLTCKVNKRFVLDSDAIQEAFKEAEVTLLRADWTRPDPEILEFLLSNERFGIPFNIVYGPNQPKGSILPELLTSKRVLEALDLAKGG